MFDVLEHIEDDAMALRWVAEQLRPGGVAVLTVPAFPFLWSQHDVPAAERTFSVAHFPVPVVLETI